MSQRPSVGSPTPLSQMPQMNPSLQAALSSLDVQLEEELVRYRRQRTGRPVPTPRGLGRRQARKTLDLISVGAVGGRTQPQATAASVAYSAAPASPNITARENPLEETRPQSWTAASPATTLTLVAQSEVSDSAEVDQQGGPLVDPTPTPAHPNDYLESSEELLRSLAEEEAEARAERGLMKSLFTPLGVGSMLLLLLSSAMFGYVMLNPSVLSHLGWGRSPQAPQSPQSSPGALTPNPAGQTNGAGLPNSPNLATQEFQDLNLNTLSNLQPSPGAPATSSATKAPSASQSPSQSASSAPSTSTSAAPPASSGQGYSTYQPPAGTGVTQSVRPLPAPVRPPQPEPEPPAPAVEEPQAAAPPPVYEPPAPAEPPASTQAPAPSAASSTQESAAASGGAYDYKVVTEYRGDPTLEQAQEVVPDAYVRNFSDGARIQLGAFDDPAKAEALVEDLQKQGIEAEVEKR